MSQEIQRIDDLVHRTPEQLARYRQSQGIQTQQQPIAPMTADALVQRVVMVEEVFQRVMKRDVHYGIVPGTDKTSLWKPGAEKLMLAFGLTTQTVIEDLSANGEVKYRIETKVFTNNGVYLGSGFGEASSLEEKYRWQGAHKKQYDATAADQRRIKFDKRTGEEKLQVRTEPDDVRNTILKMADKRSYIHATIKATGTSDMFEQDIEDLPEGLKAEHEKRKSATPKRAPQKASAGDNHVETAVLDVKTFKGKAKKSGKDFTKYTIVGQNGEYDTFSDSYRDLAEDAKRTGQIVSISFTVGQYGNSIESMGLAEGTVSESADAATERPEKLAAFIKDLSENGISEAMVCEKFMVDDIADLSADDKKKLKAMLDKIVSDEKKVEDFFDGLPF